MMSRTHRKLHEAVEVCKEKLPEAVWPCEQLLYDEEGAEPNLRVVLLQLWHDEMERMLHVVIRSSET